MRSSNAERQRRWRALHPDESRARERDYKASPRGREAQSQGRRKPARRELQRQANLKWKYGLSQERILAMLDGQGGRCATCGRPVSVSEFHVDHDHKCCPGVRSCGKCVRGLLCPACNWALGRVNDSVEVLRSMIAYLERT